MKLDKKKILEKYREEASFHGKLDYGTYEDALKFVGRTAKSEMEDPIDLFRVKQFCELVEDANLAYWDEEFAKRKWGAVPCPPAMLRVFVMRPIWRPKYYKKGRYSEWIAFKVPLPGDTVINVENEVTYHARFFVGDKLTAEEKVVDVSEEKDTALGKGHFITTVAYWRNQRGELVAEERNVIFRFKSRDEDD